MDGTLRGGSIKLSHETIGGLLSLESAYGLLRRLRLRCDAIRSRLIQVARAPPPQSATEDVFESTLQHLLAVCGREDPVGQFQLRFQTTL